MASYKLLFENYEKREKELNASLVAFYLQAGHLLISGKTDQKDDEYSRPYELISSEISSINDQCREINANERRKIELEKSVQSIRKAIQGYEPEKKNRYMELGDYIFQNYTQHFASTFGGVYSALTEEKKCIDLIQGKLSDIADQLESKDFFSKIVLYVKQSSLKNQLSAHLRRANDLKAEGAEKAFQAGAVNTDNGGMAYSACRILQEEINSMNTKLEDTVFELNKVLEKLKEADKKPKLLAIAAEKAGELDKIAESAGVKFVSKYVSPEAVILEKFPESYARIFSGVVEIRRELCSIARRKEMLRCSEQLESADASLEVLNKEMEANKADIERLVKRNEELSERIASAMAAADVIKQRKIALEVEEGISVNRLLGAVAESSTADASADAMSGSGSAPVTSDSSVSAEPANNVADATASNPSVSAESVETSVAAADVADADATRSATDATAPAENASAGWNTTGAEPAVTASDAGETGVTDSGNTGATADAPKPKRTYKKRAAKTAQLAADGEKTSSDSKAADSAGKKGKGDKQPKSVSNTAAKKVKNDKAADKTKNTKTNEEVSTST